MELLHHQIVWNTSNTPVGGGFTWALLKCLRSMYEYVSTTDLVVRRDINGTMTSLLHQTLHTIWIHLNTTSDVSLGFYHVLYLYNAAQVHMLFLLFPCFLLVFAICSLRVLHSSLSCSRLFTTVCYPFATIQDCSLCVCYTFNIVRYLFTTCSTLFATCSLHVQHCSLPVHYMFNIVHYLFTTRSTLFPTRSLHVQHCSLPVHYPFEIVHYTFTTVCYHSRLFATCLLHIQHCSLPVHYHLRLFATCLLHVWHHSLLFAAHVQDHLLHVWDHLPSWLFQINFDLIISSDWSWFTICSTCSPAVRHVCHPFIIHSLCIHYQILYVHYIFTICVIPCLLCMRSIIELLYFKALPQILAIYTWSTLLPWQAPMWSGTDPWWSLSEVGYCCPTLTEPPPLPHQEHPSLWPCVPCITSRILPL